MSYKNFISHGKYQPRRAIYLLQFSMVSTIITLVALYYEKVNWNNDFEIILRKSLLEVIVIVDAIFHDWSIETLLRKSRMFSSFFFFLIIDE